MARLRIVTTLILFGLLSNSSVFGQESADSNAKPAASKPETPATQPDASKTSTKSDEKFKEQTKEADESKAKSAEAAKKVPTEAEKKAAEQKLLDQDLKRVTWEARLVRTRKKEKRIKNLELVTKNVVITFRRDPSTNKVKRYAQIKGRYKKPDYNLLYSAKKIEPNKSGIIRFEAEVDPSKKLTKVSLQEIGPKGEPFRETFGIRVEDPADFAALDPIERAKELAYKKHSFNVSLGYSNIGYNQTGFADQSINSLTLKGAYAWRIAPTWDFGVNFFFNVLQLSATQSNIETRFLGINVRAGYKFPFVKRPWGFSLLAGFYYTRMFVTNDAFGYSDLFYPQLFPVVSRVINDRISSYLYLKFVPMSAELFSISLVERELAVGVGGFYRLKGQHSLMLAFDYSDQRFIPQAGTTIQASSFSISTGYAW